MIQLARAVAAWIFTGFYWIVALFIYLMTLRRISEKYVAGAIRFWGRTVLRILDIRLELLNPNPLLTRAPRVVICNHQSALDLVWGAAICPEGTLVIGKKEIAYVPVVNLIWWALDFIRIDRNDPARSTASLEGVVEKIVKHSRTLFLSPEGTRTPDGSLLPFKKGAFHIAIRSGAPIYPVVVTGAYECLPKKAYLPRRGVIRVRFLPIIETKGFDRKNADDLCARTREAIATAYSEIALRKGQTI